jgi:hypothetical protein
LPAPRFSLEGGLVERTLKLVPWEPTWLDNQSLDLHAVWRRPARDRDFQIMRDPDTGFVMWDVTTPAGIKNANRFRAKGMEYVTLATQEDVLLASRPEIADKGSLPLGHPARCARLGVDFEDINDYIRQRVRGGGPWDVATYLQDEQIAREERLTRVKANVEKMGAEGAELFERQSDPGYVLPEALKTPPKRRGRPPKGVEAPEPAVPA